MAPSRIRRRIRRDEPSSSSVIVLITLRAVGMQCMSAFTFFLASLGAILCMAYFLVMVLPHSLWLQEGFMNGKEVVAPSLKVPGFLLLSHITGYDMEQLKSLDRAKVSERTMSYFVELGKSMGFNSTKLESQALASWAYIEFGIDLFFIMGFIVSLMILIATVKKTSIPVGLCLSYPYILFLSIVVVLSLSMEIYLVVEFRSEARQQVSTVQGEHAYVKILMVLGAVFAVSAIGLFCAVSFVNTMGARSKEKRRRKRSLESVSSGSETEAKKKKSSVEVDQRDISVILAE